MPAVSKKQQRFMGAVLHANYHLENIEQFKTVNVLENIRINCPWAQAEDIEATLPSFLIINADPGVISLISFEFKLKVVCITGLSDATTSISSSS